MKKIIIIFLLNLSIFSMDVSAEESSFIRQQLENEHYKDFTREELSSRFGSTRALLPQYACNGVDEFDFFWMPSKNIKKNSLRIQLYKEDAKLIYQDGKYFNENGDEVVQHSNIFILKLIPIMKKLEAIPETMKMLRLLELSPYSITIKFGKNSFNPKEENGNNYQGIFRANALSILDHGRMTDENILFDEIGIGGNINWSPEMPEMPEISGEVSLAHEMYHSLDSVRGILDMRFVYGDEYEFAFVSEYRAVYFENIVRKAEGLPLRSHYGSDTSGPGVLDKNGEPRVISSPCLK